MAWSLLRLDNPLKRSAPRLRRLGLLAAVAALSVALGAPAVAPADVSAIEGQSFTGRVADIGGGCSLASALITWGDRTPDSAGAPSQDGMGAVGTHAYAEEGTYAGSVSYTCNGARVPQMASFTATVRDAQLIGAGRDFSGFATQPLTAMVAHITDTNPGGTAGDFSAQIAWGDGSTSAGAVSAAGGGGFDVSGTHTYASAGSFAVSIQILDVGGSTTTATATGQITVGTPQPLPPSGPQAQFTYSPALPCRNQPVVFDASGSTGAGAPSPSRQITRYRWSLDESAFGPTVIVTTVPTLTQSFRPSSRGVGPYRGNLQNRGDLFDYTLFRPPATVTLQITDGAGRTASVSHTVTFTNPAATTGFAVPVGADGVPDFWSPNIRILYKDSRTPAFRHCDSRSALQRLGSVALRVGPATYKAASAALMPFGKGHSPSASITVRSPCNSRLQDCFGVFVVGTRPFRGSLAGSLGQTRFFVPAGRTARVTIRLNARGTALARADKLRTVILELITEGQKGKLATTSTTVRLHTRR